MLVDGNHFWRQDGELGAALVDLRTSQVGLGRLHCLHALAKASNLKVPDLADWTEPRYIDGLCLDQVVIQAAVSTQSVEANLCLSWMLFEGLDPLQALRASQELAAAATARRLVHWPGVRLNSS